MYTDLGGIALLLPAISGAIIIFRAGMYAFMFPLIVSFHALPYG
jgi:uncharacterized membrane protein